MIRAVKWLSLIESKNSPGIVPNSTFSGKRVLKIEQVETPEQLTAVRQLLREYLDWVQTIEACSHHHPTFIGINEELASLPGLYSPPAGRLLLATVDGSAAGCVAMKPFKYAACELKRMYVNPQFRGLGVGRALVERLLQEARTERYDRIVLDSHITMKSAHQLYQSVGFKMVEPPADFPEQYKPIVVFMECTLIESAGARDI